MSNASNLSLARMMSAYNDAVPMTMTLCDRVLANCFVNASYNPARNGTCPIQEGEFYVGYQWENGKRDNAVPFPFPTFAQTAAFHSNVVFAVNTALNYII